MKKNLLSLLVLVLLCGLVYFFTMSKPSSTLADNPLSNFAIEDTSSVTKIYITDKITGSVTLERNSEKGYWMVDGEHRAKDRSVEICLQAIKNIGIKGPVSEAKGKTIITNASGSGRKIEIYTDNPDVPEKIWISAGNTEDHHGDFFILQIPGVGISPQPFIVDLPMFSGYITARFHTVKKDWRFSGIFNHENLDFKEIRVRETANPKNSFDLKWDGGEGFEVSNPMIGKPIPDLNLANAKDYILRYKKIHLETFDTQLEPNEIDSVLQRTPDWKIGVLDNEDKFTEVSLFYLPGEGNYTDFDGEALPYNQDIMFGTMGDGELFRVQYAFVFKALMEPITFFRN